MAATSVQAVIANAQRDNKKCFPYITRGKLNMICIRENREVTKVDVNTEAFLTNPAVVRGQSLDTITFHANVVFKLTLDFKESKETVPHSVREMTDWVLMSAPGQTCFYDRNVQRLVLFPCVASVSPVQDMVAPLTVILKFDEDEWIAERVFGQ